MLGINESKNQLKALFQGNDYRLKGVIELKNDLVSYVIESKDTDELTNFLVHLMRIHPCIVQFKLNGYIYGALSSVTLQRLEALSKPLLTNTFIIFFNINCISNDGFVAGYCYENSNRQALPSINYLNLIIPAFKQDINQKKLDSEKFHITSHVSPFIKTYLAYKRIYNARFDNKDELYCTWQLENMNDDLRKVFCTPLVETIPELTALFPQHKTTLENINWINNIINENLHRIIGLSKNIPWLTIYYTFDESSKIKVITKSEHDEIIKNTSYPVKYISIPPELTKMVINDLDLADIASGKAK